MARPIDHRIEATFHQALLCVEYRIPNSADLKVEAWEAALGLRYGLVGAAAAHSLLLACNDWDEAGLFAKIRQFGAVVEEHMRREVRKRLAFVSDPALPWRVASFASEPLGNYIPLYKRLCPLELCLSVACDEFTAVHKSEICRGSGIFGATRALRKFGVVTDQSYGFALSFFERRQADLDEVPEIALLGE